MDPPANVTAGRVYRSLARSMGSREAGRQDRHTRTLTHAHSRHSDATAGFVELNWAGVHGQRRGGEASRVWSDCRPPDDKNAENAIACSRQSTVTAQVLQSGFTRAWGPRVVHVPSCGGSSWAGREGLGVCCQEISGLPLLIGNSLGWDGWARQSFGRM